MAGVCLPEYDGNSCLVDKKGKGGKKEHALPLVVYNRFLGEKAQV